MFSADARRLWPGRRFFGVAASTVSVVEEREAIAAALLPRFLDTQIDSLIGKQPKKTRENPPTEKIKRENLRDFTPTSPYPLRTRISILGIISGIYTL